MPGFVEAHGHPLIGATTLTRPLLTSQPTAQAYGPDFPGLKTQAEAIAKLKEYVAAERDPKKTVLVWGYDEIAMGVLLDKKLLDTISATQPLMVWDASEHCVYASSAAMKSAGITKAAAQINGVGVGADGEPNGQFIGTTAAQYLLVPQLGALLEPKVALKNMKFLGDLSRKNGITTTSELAFGTIDIDVERHLFDTFFDEPNGKLRCVIVTDGTTLARTKKAAAVDYVKGLQQQSTDRRMFRGVKFFSDDSFLGLGMQIENPGYSDARKGLWFVKPGKEMFDQWKPCNGKPAFTFTFTPTATQAIRQLWIRSKHYSVSITGSTTDSPASILQDFDPRAKATHEQLKRGRAAWQNRMVNPYYLYHRSELNAPFVGAERSFTAARLKTLTDAGVPVSLHSDTPVGSPRPLEWVWIAVNRFGMSGTVRGPAERVTPMQAFRMATIDALAA